MPSTPVTITVIMAKIAIGAPLSGGEFIFSLNAEDDTQMYTASNDATGLITFPNVSFSSIGDYHYTAKEVSAPDGWERDNTVWPVDIEVYTVGDTDPADIDTPATLHALVSYPNGVPTFVNKLQGVTCGLFQFPELVFRAPGVYEYTLKELTPSGDGWDTDPSAIHVIVTVIDDGHGNLVAAVSYPSGFPSFTNTYNADPARIIISGCKTAIGAPLPAGRFVFGLYDQNNNLISTVTNGSANEIIVPGN